MFGVAVFNATMLNSLGAPSANSMFICQVTVYWDSRHLCSGTWGGPSANVGLSAKFGVLQYSRHLFSDYLDGGPSAKVCLSAKFGVAGIQGIYSLITWGVHQPK